MNAQLQPQAKAQAKIYFTPASSRLLQRKCACGNHTMAGECEECKSKKGAFQRRSATENLAGEVPPIVQEVLRSPGQPLDPAIRAFIEPRFGYDFSEVRVHTDARAAESARAVNALAYTVGRDIAFNAGQYAPQTGPGKNLVAHELAHVVQQAASSRYAVQSSRAAAAEASNLRLGPAKDALELEAETAARAVFGTRPSVLERSAVAPAIQRAPSDNEGLPPGRHGTTLPHREAMELLKCIEIRGEENAASCREEVLHEKPIEKPMPTPSIPCTQSEAKRVAKQAENARAAALPFVQSARLALDRLHSRWIDFKADLLAGRRSLVGEVACAFNSNFNISPSNPDYGVRQIRLMSRLKSLESRMSKAVATECQPSGDPECSGKHRDTVAYVRGGQPPIHFCAQFRDDPDVVSQQTTVVHEFAHLLPGVGDQGGYALGGFGAEVMTCKVGWKFQADSEVLTNTADALAGFVMHVGQTGATDLKVR